MQIDEFLYGGFSFFLDPVSTDMPALRVALYDTFKETMKFI
jgi:hypothetical protein